MASARYASLPLAAAAGGPPPPSVRCRRFAVGLAAVAGLVACLAIAVAKGGARHGPQVASWAAVSEPFRKYNSSAPGGLPMPDTPIQYDGIEDLRELAVVEDHQGKVHVFALGDWGAPLPDHRTAAAQGGDEWSQYDVAEAMKSRAKAVDPQYVLNVGDNFYFGGISMDCSRPPSDAYGQPTNDFSSTWQSVYGNLAKKPWLSTLGNHDYGGWLFNQGWPQQIGYSFINHNWVMPSRYYSRKMQHPGFEVEYFMIESNAFDAKKPGDDANHNICSMTHNAAGTQCAGTGSPGLTFAGCRDWFWASYIKQKQWLEERLAASTALWKIVVTHFPCGYDGSWYKSLKDKYGLDLLVTGHRHQQELWWNGTQSKYIQNFMQRNNLSDLVCFVAGGGGGITSQHFFYADYGIDLLNYGFFDLTISKTKLKIELIGIDGKESGNVTIYPQRKIGTAAAGTGNRFKV